MAASFFIQFDTICRCKRPDLLALTADYRSRYNPSPDKTTNPAICGDKQSGAALYRRPIDFPIH